ncbi:MAG: molybdenum cofactor guanylyltransferase MobA [Methylococcaceae bacterium]
MAMRGKVCGVVLAGGRAKRMAYQDKGLILYQNVPLVSYAISALSPVVDKVFINANRNIDSYAQLGLPVVSDANDCFEGPLAGVLAAMRYAQAELWLVLPCDSPLVTVAHVRTLLNAATADTIEVAIAHDGGQLQPVFMAIKSSVQKHLQDYLSAGGRKLTDFLIQLHYVTVDFSHSPELFTNINTLDQLAQLQARDA